MQPAKHAWFRPRSYRHFDYPINVGIAEGFAANPMAVERHAFYPFIKRILTSQRYIKKEHKIDVKSRPVAYAAHTDAAIFSYYSYLTSRKYEEFLEHNSLSDSVIGYRKSGKSNLHFANEIFDLIVARPSCTVIGLDIEGFFDNVPHSTLKMNLCNLFACEQLPADIYKVFRAMTKWSWVRFEDCEEALGLKIAPGSNERLCLPSEYRSKIRDAGLIDTNDAHFGIPQGSPISAVFSNVVMMGFDKNVRDFLDPLGASYRRYSDDICIVCSPGTAAKANAFVEAELNSLGLKIKHDKTEKSSFEWIGSELTSSHAFQYLGLTFDGRQRLLRNKTLAKFWQKMRRSVSKAKKSAKHGKKNGGFPQVFERKLIDRFTHLGRQNFIAYAKRASKFPNAGGVRRQVSKHWTTLQDLIDE